MIYLAPLQGFTGYIYRNAFLNTLSGIDTCFTPYITVHHQEVNKSQLADILPEHNQQGRIIPQVLIKDEQELVYLAGLLENYGYKEINLNLGCPYPMVTNRGRGSGLLPEPGKLKNILEDFYRKSTLRLSVKLRAGLKSPAEIEHVIPVLNDFPLTGVIVHARTASQLYSGEIHEEAFRKALELSRHPVVYNGDIFTVDDFSEIKQKYPEVEKVMLGRGVLMNPLLPALINGSTYTADERAGLLRSFHDTVYNEFLRVMDNPGNALNKMKQFWIYFSHNFNNQHKTLKVIKKTRNVNEYVMQVNRLLG